MTGENYRTSRAYEQLVEALIRQEMGAVAGIELLEISRDAHLRGSSGYVHQIDVVYRFRIWRTDFLVLVECKQYQKKVGVDELLEFKSRIDDIGAHKGIFITSSHFQSGAVQFAEANRIALLIVRGTMHQDVAYFIPHHTYADRCATQVNTLVEAYRLTPSITQARIRLEPDKPIQIVHAEARISLEPSELNKCMLYLRPWPFLGLDDDFYFEHSRLHTVRKEKLLKTLLIEELLCSSDV